MLRGAGIRIVSTHDIIIRGLTIRPGDDPEGPRPGVRRAITIWGSTDNPSYNIVVDHNSLSWSTDEVIGVGYAQDVTFQYNFITEPLHNSIHQEGPHGYTFAPYGNKEPMERLSVHHNLIAHGYNRNPQYANGVSGEAINNLIYDWGNRGLSIKADAFVLDFGQILRHEIVQNGENVLELQVPAIGDYDCTMMYDVCDAETASVRPRRGPSLRLADRAGLWW